MSSETGLTALVGSALAGYANAAGRVPAPDAPGPAGVRAIKAQVLEGELLAGGARREAPSGHAFDQSFGRRPAARAGLREARPLPPDPQQAAAFYHANASAAVPRRGIDVFA